MYAVIATGGKQYRVQEGAVVRVEKLDADQGASVEFNQVLLVGAASPEPIGSHIPMGRSLRSSLKSRRLLIWHTKKLAAVLATAAIRIPSDWASRSSAGRRCSRAPF